ncbi:hypothetical protein [Nonomuraea recticatena]|uniref:PPE family protein n=1 Tax=Nonomuraea recticatena TaxID=46178 RepID=A0ABP6FWD7_9ACTN
MAVTIPSEFAAYAEVAALVGVPADLFVWDPDALDRLAGTISAFRRDVNPGMQEVESAAGQYTMATHGAEGDAFDQHWQAIAAGGDSGDVPTIASWAAGLLSLGAIAIKIAQTAVVTQLAWCAPQLAASAAAGPAGVLNATRAIATARATIGAIVRELTDRLDRLIAPKLHQAGELFRRLGRQFDPRTALNGGHRLVPADGPTRLSGTPYPKGGDSMNITRGGDGDVSPGSTGDLPILPENAAGQTFTDRWRTAAKENHGDGTQEAWKVAKDGRNN